MPPKERKEPSKTPEACGLSPLVDARRARPTGLGAAARGPNGLIIRFYALRPKDVEKFSDEDFRLAIGQQIALQHLMPLAIARLEENPLLEGDCYEGDVLNAVLTVDEAFWSEHPALKLKVDHMLDRLDQLPEREEFDKFQIDAIERFRTL